MVAPVNVLLKGPSNPTPDWIQEESIWIGINKTIGGNPDFYPLTIKAAYVIGIIHNICQSVEILLADKSKVDITYMSAYGLSASGLDILGRCVSGDENNRGSCDLVIGLKWLSSSNIHAVNQNSVFFITAQGQYSISDLNYLRHYALHGQATAQVILPFDLELLDKLLPLYAAGLERYWSALQNNSDLCENLAKAKIIPFRNYPVLKSWLLFEKDQQGIYHSVEDIFNQLDWKVT
jgi:hypothetical protein